MKQCVQYASLKSALTYSTWLLCAVVFSIVYSTVALADRVVLDVDEQEATVYSEDSSRSTRIGRLQLGESAILIDAMPRWFNIRLDNGHEGFVSKRKTRIVDELSTTPALRIHYINVGSGTCTLVECPGENASPMLIDCGSVGTRPNDRDQDETRAYVVRVLDNHSAPLNVLISHPHKDHYGLIPHVLSDVQVGQIWLGGDSDGYRLNRFPQWRRNQELNGAIVHEGLPVDFHNDQQPMENAGLSCGLADVFTLTVNSGDTVNATSHVLEIEYNDFVATFTGDAEGATERQSIDNFSGNIDTTVLSASHHGSNSHGSNDEEWIETTDPEVVIFSTGPRFGHPRCNVVSRFNELSPAQRHPIHCGRPRTRNFSRRQVEEAIYVTAVNGAITITSTGESPLRIECDRTESCNTHIAHD